MDELRQGSLSVGELASELDRIGEKSFLQKYPHPFLLEVYTPQDDLDFDEDAQTGEVSVVDFPQEVSKWMVMKAVAVSRSDRIGPEQRILVGRSRSNDIVLRGSKVSKQHAAFYREGEHWHLVDMGSANGTAVNGNRLKKNQKTKIKSRDVISFWQYTFEFHEANSFIVFLLKVVLRKGFRTRRP